MVDGGGDKAECGVASASEKEVIRRRLGSSRGWAPASVGGGGHGWWDGRMTGWR